MKLVALYIYIDSPDQNADIPTFGGETCVDQAIAYCIDNYIQPADVCKVSGTVEYTDGMSGQVMQRSWPNPDLPWFRRQLREKYVESRSVAKPNAESSNASQNSRDEEKSGVRGVVKHAGKVSKKK